MKEAIETIKAMETWETETRNCELRGEGAMSMDKLDPDASSILYERLTERDPCVSRLREIEVQVARALGVAEETKESIHRGDQVRMSF